MYQSKHCNNNFTYAVYGNSVDQSTFHSLGMICKLCDDIFGFFLDAESFSIWSISHYYFDFKSKDIERGKLFFNAMFSIEGVKFSSFDLLWLVLNMIICLLCFQFEGKQMFSCPVIIVEALENVTNFVSILKRYVIWYIWIWYCSSIFFSFLYVHDIWYHLYHLSAKWKWRQRYIKLQRHL